MKRCFLLLALCCTAALGQRTNYNTQISNRPIVTGLTDTGSNNAIATSSSSTAPALSAGLIVVVQLAHTLQAGANTFAYNSGSALAIKSGFNTSNNIGTAYAATGVIVLYYNGTVWLDLKQ